MLTEERLRVLLAYCRIDETEIVDKGLITQLYYAAVSYMADAGVAEPADGLRKARYDQCVNALVLAMWDVREPTVTGSVTDNPVFRRMLTQLKLTEPEVVSDSDTTAEAPAEGAVE